MKLVFAAVFSSILLIPTFSYAGWNYLTWGTTHKAAIDSSKGEARKIQPADERWAGCLFVNRKPFAVIPAKQIGEFKFSAAFCSIGDQRTLYSVVLTMNQQALMPSLRRSLASQYGKPVSVNGTLTIWNDRKTGNTVTFSDDEIYGKIEYRNFASSGL